MVVTTNQWDATYITWSQEKTTPFTFACRIRQRHRAARSRPREKATPPRYTPYARIFATRHRASGGNVLRYHAWQRTGWVHRRCSEVHAARGTNATARRKTWHAQSERRSRRLIKK